MLRVVYLNCHRAPRGNDVERVLVAWPTLADVPAALARAGMHVEVVQAAPRAAWLQRDGVTYRFAPGGPLRLAEAVAARCPDVVHHQSFRFPVHARALHRRLPRVPILLQDHGGSPPAGWRRLLAAWGTRHVAAVAFTAREQACAYVQRAVLRPDTPVFEVLESSSHFMPQDQAVAGAATGLAGDPCLLWIGRLDANKDPLAVLAAFRRARRQLSDPHLWMCYTAAPLLSTVRRWLASEPELVNRVHLLGAVPHQRIEQLCSAADFLVSGSHDEGSGYALLEALACGTTPLVTDIPSFRRITGGGKVGALVPPGDAVQMARAMVEWSSRDRVSLRQQARSHFDRALSFRVVAAELRAAYESILAAR